MPSVSPLAVFVVVDHSSMIGFGAPSRFTYLGGFAVDAFFAISGYLVTGSRVRTGTGAFLWRRVIRLMPAYWAALLATALLIAPASARMSHIDYDWIDGAAYVARNAVLFTVQAGIGATPSDVPYFGLWNGAVWSLPNEGCRIPLLRSPGGYATVPGRMVGRRVRDARWGSPVAAGFGSGLILRARVLLRLWSFFAAGMLIWFLRARLPQSVALAAAASTLVAGALAVNHVAYLTLAPAPLAYVLLWVGARLPLRIGSRNDLSYGIYVFAFPLQQYMAVTGVPKVTGQVGFMIMSVLATVPVACASWFLVERPCMGLRRLVPSGVSHTTAQASAATDDHAGPLTTVCGRVRGRRSAGAPCTAWSPSQER